MAAKPTQERTLEAVAHMVDAAGLWKRVDILLIIA